MKGYYNHKTGLWSAVVRIAGNIITITANSLRELSKKIESLTNKKTL
jgi:hypothetical protein